MRCYVHRDLEAVGTCKFCGRGVCPTCAVEVDKALACRDRCESEVSTILTLNRNALQFAKTTKEARYLFPVMLIVIGGVLATLGITYDGIDVALYGGSFVIVVGIAFLVIQYRMVQRIKA